MHRFRSDGRGFGRMKPFAGFDEKCLIFGSTSAQVQMPSLRSSNCYLKLVRLPQQSLNSPLSPIDSICEIILRRFNRHQNHAFDLFFRTCLEDCAVDESGPMCRCLSGVVIRRKRSPRSGRSWRNRDYAMETDFIGFENHTAIEDRIERCRAMLDVFIP